MIRTTGVDRGLYTAELSNVVSDVFGYAARLSKINAMFEWCNENFGENCSLSEYHTKFYFVNEQDRTLFLLRWS